MADQEHHSQQDRYRPGDHNIDPTLLLNTVPDGAMNSMPDDWAPNHETGLQGTGTSAASRLQQHCPYSSRRSDDDFEMGMGSMFNSRSPPQDPDLQGAGYWMDPQQTSQEEPHFDRGDDENDNATTMELDPNGTLPRHDISITLDNFDHDFQQEHNSSSERSPPGFQLQVTLSLPVDNSQMMYTPPSSSHGASFQGRLRPEADSFFPHTPVMNEGREHGNDPGAAYQEQPVAAHNNMPYGQQYTPLSMPPPPQHPFQGRLRPRLLTNMALETNLPLRTADNVALPGSSHCYPSPASTNSGPNPYPIDTPTSQSGQTSFQDNISSMSQLPVNVHDWTQDNPNRTNNQPSQQQQQQYLNTPTPTPTRSRRRATSRASSAASHTCSSCSKVFESKTEHDHHQRYHGDKPHQCSLCEKSFTFHKDLKRHMKTHTQERHLLCNVIGCEYRTKGFPRKDQVVRHMEKVHRKEWVPEQR